MTLSQPFFGMSMSMIPQPSVWPPPIIPNPPPPRPRPAAYPYGLRFYSPTDFAKQYVNGGAASQQQAAFRALDFTSHSPLNPLPLPPYPPLLPPFPEYYGFDAKTASTFDKSNRLPFDPTEKAMYYKAILDTDPADIANPKPWTQYTTMSSFRTMMASTLLLSNVVSFHVQVMPPGIGGAPPDWQDVHTTFIPNVGAVYDTANIGLNGSNILVSPLTNLLAMRVTLRVWDPRSQQARQATLVQDFY